jgi:guanine deaminase
MTIIQMEDMMLEIPTHEYFMQEAIRLAEDSVASGGGPFGSVVVKNGVIIGRGNNRVTVWNDPTAHGEIVAIRDACTHLNSYQLDGCILYTNAEPCPMCLGAIYWARPSAVYFALSVDEAAAIGFDDTFIYEEIAMPQPERSIPFVHLDIPSASAAFAAWKGKGDKVEY